VTAVQEAVAAIHAAKLVLMPTDTVYGLACRPDDEETARTLSALKGRDVYQPIAIVASSIDVLLERVPELRGEDDAIVRRLLPGPYTLVVQNPALRYPWLAGARPDTIGVRVPDLAGPGREVLEAVGAVAATSANIHGAPDPRRVADVSDEILSAVAAVIDGGDLPGTPSTVLDLTGPEPRVLREGAVPADEALAAAQ
jgi:L-threonylcarbamoyladenylate synthase